MSCQVQTSVAAPSKQLSPVPTERAAWRALQTTWELRRKKFKESSSPGCCDESSCNYLLTFRKMVAHPPSGSCISGTISFNYLTVMTEWIGTNRYTVISEKTRVFNIAVWRNSNLASKNCLSLAGQETRFLDHSHYSHCIDEVISTPNKKETAECAIE